MSEITLDLSESGEAQTAASEAPQSGPQLPPRPKSKVSQLWQHFDIDPSLGQSASGPKSTNPFAKCKLCPSEKFHPKGNSGLMNHLMICKGILPKQLAEAHQTAKDENISYAGKPKQLAGIVQNSKTASGRKRQRSWSSGSLHSHWETRTPSAEEKGRISRALLLFFVMCGVSSECWQVCC